MQNTNSEKTTDAEYHEDARAAAGGNSPKELNTASGSHRTNDRSRNHDQFRNNRGGRGGNREGRGRGGARVSENWREDRIEGKDQQASQRSFQRNHDDDFHRDGARRQPNNNYPRNKHRDPFPFEQKEKSGDNDEGHGAPQSRPRGDGARRGRGRGGFHQYRSHDEAANTNSEDFREDAPVSHSHDTQASAPACMKNEDYATAEARPPRSRFKFNEQAPQRGGRGGYQRYDRDHRGWDCGFQGNAYHQQGRYGRDTEGNEDGDHHHYHKYDDDGCEGTVAPAFREGLPKEGVVRRDLANDHEEIQERERFSGPQVLPPGFKRRTQRAPHLRKNCFDETEVLELFSIHHQQKGISLDNYENIPVEMVPRDIMAVEDFSDLRTEPALVANIERCGYKKPTPVQRYGIPVALAGNDLMACAQTGSGKTAAFLIPIVQYILVNGVSPAKRGVSYPIGLIMAPTRELALQIYDEVRKLAFRTDIFYDVTYGGTPYPTRFENDILVACPGRLKDIFDRGCLSFEAIKFLVLDEADRMLEMGFEEQIEYLVASRYTDMPKVDDRQTLMFSATFPTRILNLARRYLRKQYYLLTVGRVGSTTKNITQVILRVQESEKVDRLFELIYAHKKSDLVLIFVETKKAAEDLHRELKKELIPSSTIHGDRRQQDRERALAEFKSGETPLLVATDVASRGLDIPDVAHVIQFDLPSEMDDYVHRIGRTGRAGNKGTATCFYNRNNRRLCLDLYRYMREHEQEIPSWFKEEAELVEGEAMLSNDFGSNRRRGGGGGGGGYRRNDNNQRDSNETWADMSSGMGAGGGGRGRGKLGSRAGDSAGGFGGRGSLGIDDGGF